MGLAVAQYGAIKGDVNANIESHIQFLIRASKLGVDYLVFPELSLTGYELTIAKQCAFTVDDTRLIPLIDAVKRYNVNIAVGLPLLKDDDKLTIGQLTILTSGELQLYEKIHLHEGESDFFVCGEQHHSLPINEHTIASAICADTINPVHVKQCVEKGANIYLAGVLVTPTGYDIDAAMWASYASEYKILVGISNYNKPSGGLPAAGKSAMAGQCSFIRVIYTNRIKYTSHYKELKHVFT
jgi:predicted amidohydrolase